MTVDLLDTDGNTWVLTTAEIDDDVHMVTRNSITKYCSISPLTSIVGTNDEHIRRIKSRLVNNPHILTPIGVLITSPFKVDTVGVIHDAYDSTLQQKIANELELPDMQFLVLDLIDSISILHNLGILININDYDFRTYVNKIDTLLERTPGPSIKSVVLVNNIAVIKDYSNALSVNSSIFKRGDELKYSYLADYMWLGTMVNDHILYSIDNVTNNVTTDIYLNNMIHILNFMPKYGYIFPYDLVALFRRSYERLI